ncbi:MAG: hypothetical protein AAF577_17540 [Pseudomonadota bacterium]
MGPPLDIDNGTGGTEGPTGGGRGAVRQIFLSVSGDIGDVTERIDRLSARIMAEPGCAPLEFWCLEGASYQPVPATPSARIPAFGDFDLIIGVLAGVGPRSLPQGLSYALPGRMPRTGADATASGADILLMRQSTRAPSEPSIQRLDSVLKALEASGLDTFGAIPVGVADFRDLDGLETALERLLLTWLETGDLAPPDAPPGALSTAADRPAPDNGTTDPVAVPSRPADPMTPAETPAPVAVETEASTQALREIDDAGSERTVFDTAPVASADQAAEDNPKPSPPAAEIVHPATAPVPAPSRPAASAPQALVPSTDAKHPVTPFPGLAPFSMPQAPYFAGREQALEEALDALALARAAGAAFLIVHGPSGSGATSFAAAGLLPRVLEESGAPTPAVVAITPAAKPADALSRALSAGDDSRGVVLLIDRLERVLQAAEPLQRDALIATVDAIARTPGGTVIATARGDEQARLQRRAPLATLLEAGAEMRLAPLSRAGLEAAVRTPAAKVGLRFGRRASDGRRLDQILLDDAGGSDALPLVALALQSLARRAPSDNLEIAAYEALGGLNGLAAGQAERAIMAHGGEVEAALRRIVLCLVEMTGNIDDGPDATLAAKTADLTEIAPDADAMRLVEALVGARVLVRDGRLVRLALPSMLRDWPRGRAILTADTSLLATRATIEPLAEAWAASGRERGRLLPAGRLLRASMRAVAADPDALSATARSFIIRADERRRHRQLGMAAIAIVAVTAAAMIATLIFGGDRAAAPRAVATVDRVSDSGVDTREEVTSPAPSDNEPSSLLPPRLRITPPSGRTEDRSPTIEDERGTAPDRAGAAQPQPSPPQPTAPAQPLAGVLAETPVDAPLPGEIDTRLRATAPPEPSGATAPDLVTQPRALSTDTAQLQVALADAQARLQAAENARRRAEDAEQAALTALASTEADRDTALSGEMAALEARVAAIRSLQVARAARQQAEARLSDARGERDRAIGALRRAMAATAPLLDTILTAPEAAAAAGLDRDGLLDGMRALRQTLSAGIGDGAVNAPEPAASLLASGDRLLGLGRPDRAREAYRRALAALDSADEVSVADRIDAPVPADRVLILARIARAASASGSDDTRERIAEALSAARALAPSRLRADDEPDTVALQRLSETLEIAADHAALAGDQEAAETAHGEALMLRRRLALSAPGSPSAQSALAAALNADARRLSALGRTAAAVEGAAEAATMLRALSAANPNDRLSARRLANALSTLGRARLALGETEGARLALGDSLEINRRLQVSADAPDAAFGVIAALVSLAEAAPMDERPALLNEARERTAELTAARQLTARTSAWPEIIEATIDALPTEGSEGEPTGE